MFRKLVLHIMVVLLVLAAFVAIPDRAFVGNHDNAPPERGITALEQRIGELESQVQSLDGQVVDLQTQIDDILERLPRASGITLNASAQRVAPGANVHLSGIVVDQFGSALPGAVVEFEATGGSIPDHATTNTNGQYSATFIAPESFNESVTITASVNGAVEQAIVGTSGAPHSIVFDLPGCAGFECTLITVTVRDEAGDAVIGASVEVHESADNRTFTRTTNNSGTATISLFSDQGLDVIDTSVTITVRQLDVEIEQVINISS